MKFFVAGILSLVMCLCGALSFAGSQDAMWRSENQFNKIPGGQPSQLGTKVIRDSVHELVVQYSFAVSGGATGTLKLPVPISKGSTVGATTGTLPKGALVIGCYVDNLTNLAGTSALVALSTGQGAGDLVATSGTAGATVFTGISACVPTGTAATSIKLTADQTPQMVISGAALTAGKLNLHIMYVMSDY